MLNITNKVDSLEIELYGMLSDEVATEICNSIKQSAKAGLTKIKMLINSYGGSVKGAWDIISTISENNMYLHAINTGFAVSAASLVLAKADYAECYEYSTAMIHDPIINGVTLAKSTGSNKTLLTAIKDGIMAVLNYRFKLPELELSNLLSIETSMNATTQLSMGLVDNVIKRNDKPLINNEMDQMEIYNIIQEFNIKNMDIENKIEDEVKPVETIIVANELEIANIALVSELKELKIENFILKNDMSDKVDMIENAVEKHGVEILDTLLGFLSIENKVELEDKVETLEKIIIENVNDANDAIEGIVNSTNVNVVDYESLANEVFGVDGDPDKAYEIKNEQPELFEKLKDIFYS